MSIYDLIRWGQPSYAIEDLLDRKKAEELAQLKWMEDVLQSESRFLLSGISTPLTQDQHFEIELARIKARRKEEREQKHRLLNPTFEDQLQDAREDGRQQAIKAHRANLDKATPSNNSAPAIKEDHDQVAPAQFVVLAPQQQATPAPERRILKRAALIEQHERDWPTIRADLNEASRNGLRAAASLGGGMWSVDAARAWAEPRRKIRQASHAPEPATWMGPVTKNTLR